MKQKIEGVPKWNRKLGTSKREQGIITIKQKDIIRARQAAWAEYLRTEGYFGVLGYMRRQAEKARIAAEAAKKKIKIEYKKAKPKKVTKKVTKPKKEAKSGD